MVQDMFVLGMPVLEKILRTLIVYGAMVIGLRLAGKRELAQVNTLDFIVLLLLSNTVQNAIIGDDNTVSGGLLGAATLVLTNALVVRLTYTSPRAAQVVEGTPTILIADGQPIEANWRRELITREELLIAAQKQGFDSLDTIKQAVLEPGGTLSFVGKHATDDMQREALQQQLDTVLREVRALRAQLDGNARPGTTEAGV